MTSSRERLRQHQELADRQRRDRRILIGVAIGLVLVLVGGGLGLQAWRTGRSPSAVPAPSASGTPVTITNGQPIVFGLADAPVTLRLYEDFHCPHCVDFEEEFGTVIADLQASGQAKVALYPMAFIDEGSPRAANALACAAEAGFGPAYYSGLFGNATLAWRDDQLLELAEQVTGSVPEGFRRCVVERRHAGWVESINEAAQAAGVTQTPTVFLDDAPVDISTLTPEALRARVQEAAQS